MKWMFGTTKSVGLDLGEHGPSISGRFMVDVIDQFEQCVP